MQKALVKNMSIDNDAPFKALSSSVALMKIRDKDGNLEEVKLNRSTAIRRFCIECMGFAVGEVTHCTCPHCPLFPFRGGGSVKAAIKKTEEIIAKKDEPKKPRKPRTKKVV